MNKKSSKLIVLIGMLLISCFMYTDNYAQEQHQNEEEFNHHCNLEERSLTLGLGAPYSFGIESIGINFRMYYNIGEQLCFGPEYSYFKNEEYEIIDFDFVGHYIFETKLIGIYPLFGGNYTIENELKPETETEDSFGIIYGVGVHRNFNNLAFFAEYSRVEFGLEDQFVSAGILFLFK